MADDETPAPDPHEPLDDAHEHLDAVRGHLARIEHHTAAAHEHLIAAGHAADDAGDRAEDLSPDSSTGGDAHAPVVPVDISPRHPDFPAGSANARTAAAMLGRSG